MTRSKIWNQSGGVVTLAAMAASTSDTECPGAIRATMKPTADEVSLESRIATGPEAALTPLLTDQPPVATIVL